MEIGSALELIPSFNITCLSVAPSCSIKIFIIALLRNVMKKHKLYTHMTREITLTEL